MGKIYNAARLEPDQSQAAEQSATPTTLLFKAGENCWRSGRAAFATPLVDCANFYRALHAAICKAQHSIFIIGWDIDSRIRLLHGEEAAQAKAPSVISDLLAWKATENPDLKVYLLRWDSSLAFLGMREVWAKEVWDEKTPDNVQTCLDGTIPMGGSQHQKVVLIDDEIAFSGGMDVAVNRWDTRDHAVVQPEREDDDGPYGPLHDVQVVVAGPIVEALAELVRWRWNRAADDKAIPIRDLQRYPLNQVPPSWPEQFPPYFHDIDCAIARTIPLMDNATPAQEVRRMFLDLIASAERFIYIENQFATRAEIAEALNAQLRKHENLRLLLVSSYRPKGTFESEAYWAGRIDFKAILERGINPARIRMVYSSSHDEHGNFGHKRVHSKVMAIDDKYLVIGSANISNRSMSLDTECDLVFAASTEEHRRQILDFRNDLIGEHCSRSADEVGRLLERKNGLRKLMKPARKHGYALHEVADELFTDKSLQSLMSPFSDPEDPIVPPVPLMNGKWFFLSNPSKKTLLLAGIVCLVAVLMGLGYLANQHIPWFTADNMKSFLEDTRGTMWALPAVLIIYVVGGIIFFPVTVLSLAVAAVFGPIWGPIYGISGALLSAALLFGAGHGLGKRGLRRIGGSKVQLLDEKFRRSGIIGVAAIRLIPIAPYSLVNLVAGISSIRLYQFLAGTFLGMFPPMVAKGLVGDSLTQIFINPSVKNISYLALGILAWAFIIFLSQKFVNWYQRRNAAAAAAVDDGRA